MAEWKDWNLMPTTPRPKYELELWINGAQVGDISRLAQNRRYTIKRNDSEELAFLMNISAFEDYCDSLGTVPDAVLKPYVTDIRVRRNGTYIFGVQVVDMQYNLNEGEVNVEIKCTGFLDLFKDRYLTIDYVNTDAAEIARDLLEESQDADPLDDFGVVDGPSQEDTGVLRDRTYVDQNIKEAIINLTNLVDGNFDFRFNYDRSFETFEMIGSNRPANKLTYPYNIKSMTIPRSALSLYNQIIALGSGFGEETLRTVVADTDSRLNYGTRQKIVSFNSVVLQDTLDENAAGYLAQVKEILELPSVKVSGSFLDLNVVWIGDRIPIEVQGHSSIALEDTYRIEQISCAIDENDAEDIDLVLDNIGF